MQVFCFTIENMKNIRELLDNILNKDFVSGTISNPRTKGQIQKIKVRPILKREDLYFQLESFTKTQAFHENLRPREAAEKCTSYMEEFKQMQMMTKTENHNIRISNKGKVTIQSKKQQGGNRQVNMQHNRAKKYILEEGIAVPFLIDLGVMTEEGKIVRTKFDKYRQINRFLEFVEDILPQLDKDREVTILDFGCGKSYLTFAMYYYLHELKKYDIRIIGLDLKSEVIKHCSQLAVKYGYEKLAFLEGNIADYTGVDAVDMVVTLHACDTATDFALAKAIGWNAKVILSVPCCQHELNGQIDKENVKMAPVMRYGLLKKRMSALFTDGLRADYLEREGYETQVLEFIDMEHTPKNILIRGVKNRKLADNKEHWEQKNKEIQECTAFLKVDPMLGRLLDDGDWK